MPSKYLLAVNSRPQPGAEVDDDLWVKWYTKEHVRYQPVAIPRYPLNV